MTVLAQVGPALPPIPEIPWGAISPELVLFGTGILVLLLDIAGENRLRSSGLVLLVALGGAGLGIWQTDEQAIFALLALAGVTQLILVWGWTDRPRLLGALLAGLGFAGALGVTAWQWAVWLGPEVVATDQLFAQMVAVDGVALFTRVTVCVAGLITLPIGYAYLEDRRIHRGEYYPLLLFAATGMTLLGSSADLLMVFISVEILSLALYILAGFAKRDLGSQESAFKYFLLGAFSSALLLYGIALVYGATGTTNIAAAGRQLAMVDTPMALSLAAITLLLVGFAFKTALVPFHMWTPDVYQGAPTPITGFMAAATKAAAFAAFLRVLFAGLGPLEWSWQPALWLIAAATMLLGSVLAVVQDDLKRMLAYSSVAHAGFVAVGLMAVGPEGISAVLLYVLLYAFMSLGAFGVLSVLERRQRKAMAIGDLRGLGTRYPVLAGMFALFLLALAGIPGTAGFVAKVSVFRAAIDAGFVVGEQWLVALVVIAVVSSAIAAFFYIRVIVAMFMEDEPAELADLPVRTTTGASLGLSAAAAAVLVLGILPGALLDLVAQAASLAG